MGGVPVVESHNRMISNLHLQKPIEHNGAPAWRPVFFVGKMSDCVTERAR